MIIHTTQSLLFPRLPRFLILLAMLGLAACEKDPPEQRLSETADNLDSAVDVLRSLDEEIRQHEESLEKLRKERRGQAAKLRSLEDRLLARSTDVALFRSIQSALLDDPVLQETAISVGVEDADIVLRGVVGSDAEREHAISIARSTAGVKGVTSRLEVDGSPEESAAGE